MASPLPALSELLTLRGGRVDASFGEGASIAGASSPPPRARILCLADQAEATRALAQQMAAATQCTVWVDAANNTPATALSKFAELAPAGAIFPLAAAASPAESQAEAKRLATWSQQQHLQASRVVLQLFLPSPSTDALAPFSAERVQALGKLGGSWLVRVPSLATAASASTAAMLTALLAHSSLPVVLAATVEPTDVAVATAVPATPAAANATSVALRLLDRLASLSSLQRLHVAFTSGARTVAPSSSPSAPLLLNAALLEQHWSAMRRREEFRAAQQAQQASNARPHHAGAIAASSASGAIAAVSTPAAAATNAAAVVPAAAPAATFYRAAFTPSTMYFRVSLFLAPPGAPSAPALTSAPISELTAHGLLCEAVRSLLGSVGLAKAALQLLAWHPQSGGPSAVGGYGLVAVEASMTVGVRAAFTLLGSFQGQLCRIEVQQQSLFLATLACDP